MAWGSTKTSNPVPAWEDQIQNLAGRSLLQSPPEFRLFEGSGGKNEALSCC